MNMIMPPVERLITEGHTQFERGQIILCDQGALLSPHFEENLLKVVWTISGLKESYLKLEASEYYFCSRTLTGLS